MGSKLQRKEDDMVKQLERDTMLREGKQRFERSLKRKQPQECRAHEAGRCTKSSDVCTESHLIPDEQIKCCSILKPGDPYYNPAYSRCRFAKLGMTCPYKHTVDDSE